MAYLILPQTKNALHLVVKSRCSKTSIVLPSTKKLKAEKYSLHSEQPECDRITVIGFAAAIL